MQSIFQYPAPGIVPGTNFNLDRFYDLYRWIAHTGSDSIRLQAATDQFGLVYHFQDQPSLLVEVNGNRLTVGRCMAVTPGGDLIGIEQEINGPMECELTLDTDGTHELFDIYVVVQCMEEWRHFGTPSPEEVPCRKPYTALPYGIEIRHREKGKDIVFPNSLKIGELCKTKKGFQLAPYLPPCRHLGAHPDLWRKTLNYQQYFRTLFQALSALLHAIPEDEPDQDIMNLRRMVDKMGFALAADLPAICYLDKRSTPYQLFRFCKAFASRLRFFLDTLTRESELLELIRQNITSHVGIGFEPQTFRDAIGFAEETDFVPAMAEKAFEQMDSFFEKVVQVFETLGRNSKIYPVKNITTTF